jgi:hypothetical protein
MMLQLDGPEMTEIGVELAYGIIYLFLMGFIFKKYRATRQKLALYFGLAFLCLGASGVYGGTATLLSKLGFAMIPLIGEKIVEIYTGLAIASLAFFFVGLIRLK